MDFEQEQDLKVLYQINLWGDTSLESLSLFLVFNKIDTVGFLNKSEAADYIEVKGEGTAKQKKVFLTKKGSAYLEWLSKEKEKETIDLKIKSLTVENSKWQKYTPIISACIAALSLIATMCIAYFNYAKKTPQYIPVQEMQKLEQSQEKINKSIIQYLDSLRAHQK